LIGGAVMIYDCFMFCDELDLLEIRLHELADLVDKFVVVEGDLTLSGKPKPVFDSAIPELLPS
jgi:beta-1,4-mannosyl-glycoprotein beta-1,4-N-acetylglucosaminyltransferase